MLFSRLVSMTKTTEAKTITKGAALIGGFGSQLYLYNENMNKYADLAVKTAKHENPNATDDVIRQEAKSIIKFLTFEP